MKKLNIAVIFGGCSSEYEVSLQSAYSVITHFDLHKYEPVLIGITPDGEWFRYIGSVEKIKDGTWVNTADCIRAIISPCRETKGILEFGTNETRIIHLDAAMPILHGKNGEDGTVQGLLELAGIPIIGCKTMASALCMDKDRAHKIVSFNGIRVPQAFVLKNDNEVEFILNQAAVIGYPLFVKPVKAGSSFGISKVDDRESLLTAVKMAFLFDDEVIVEESITGIEIGSAVLGNEELIVGEPDEIEITESFFDFKEKYTLETSKIHVPARISAEKTAEIKDIAKRIYRALGCTGFARVDVFLTPDGEIVFNEVNTIPGFTVNSRYPKMLGAIGMTMGQIVRTAVRQAIKEL
ncbi:MAG: D-alanine--D-serine ligase VanG [Lachnospiraceae bacterium]|nr:D-alanine--D-serine ligase VanG [Lachnospiraceae bacterium]